MSNAEAVAALDAARKCHADGDDAAALRMAEESLRICGSDEARGLADHIRKFGDGSEMAATVRLVMEAPDLYAVLQIARDAMPGDVKKAYHLASKMVHPDKNRARLSDEAFKRVGEAFNTLSDPGQKQVYDLKQEGPLPARSRKSWRPRASRQPAPAPPASSHVWAADIEAAWAPRRPWHHMSWWLPTAEESELQQLRRVNEALLREARAAQAHMEEQLKQAMELLKQKRRDLAHPLTAPHRPHRPSPPSPPLTALSTLHRPHHPSPPALVTNPQARVAGRADVASARA